jgi:hypothetical protein
MKIALIADGELARILAEDLPPHGELTADAGLFGTRGTPEFARRSDWRTEADCLLQHAKKD